MDGNKDESQRCIHIALEAAKSGDLLRAEKFLRKADNLFPSPKAKGIVPEPNKKVFQRNSSFVLLKTFKFFFFAYRIVSANKCKKI